MPEDVFIQDNPQIHHGSDGNGDTGKCHNVGIYTKVLHEDEAHEHRQRQEGGYQNRSPQVVHHHNNYNDGDQNLEADGFIQGTECLVDQSGAVVKRDNGHFRNRAVFQCFGWQAIGYGIDFFFYRIDDFQRIITVAGNDHTAHCFGS